MRAEVEPIEVVPYDPSWPAWFEQERSRLRNALGEMAVAIEHAGSTAVPGLAAEAARFRLNREAYLDGKSALVREIEARARAWRNAPTPVRAGSVRAGFKPAPTRFPAPAD